MPITRMKTAANPYAPLAWTTSKAVLALEKLRKDKSIRDDELGALKEVAEQLDLLYEASQISLTDPNKNASPYMEPRLRTSFFTLLAIREKSLPPIKLPAFKEAGSILHAIHGQYKDSNNPEDLDPAMLKDAQDVCVEFLEHLNKQHPSVTSR